VGEPHRRGADVLHRSRIPATEGVGPSVNCANCGAPIPPARREALPEETWCKDCVEKTGDVERIRGVMMWDHKTAPYIYTGPGTDKLLASQRTHLGANLPFTSKESPFTRNAVATINLSEGLNLKDRKEEVPNLIPELNPARCHPDRPRATPDGKCLDCAMEWYRRRIRK
jgi:hypothetical protein